MPVRWSARDGRSTNKPTRPRPCPCRPCMPYIRRRRLACAPPSICFHYILSIFSAATCFVRRLGACPCAALRPRFTTRSCVGVDLVSRSVALWVGRAAVRTTAAGLSRTSRRGTGIGCFSCGVYPWSCGAAQRRVASGSRISTVAKL